MIRQRNLSLLSNRTARYGGRRITETVLERDYCLSWFLVGLSRSPLRYSLLFKGGTAIKKCYIPDYRFSEDLDFTLTDATTLDDIIKKLEVAFRETHKASGVILEFSRLDRRSHVNSHTFFVRYEGPLPGVSRKEVKVDVTIRECVFFPIEDRLVLKGYDEYEDLPDDAIVRTYSIAEIAAEKVVALLDRARNEPRDLYDLWYLVSTGHVDTIDLMEAVEQKLLFRGKNLTDVEGELLRKENYLERLWERRLSVQVSRLPGFEQVYRETRRALKQAGLSI